MLRAAADASDNPSLKEKPGRIGVRPGVACFQFSVFEGMDYCAAGVGFDMR